MENQNAKDGHEEQFVNQAAHLLLALAGIKPLPKSSGKIPETILEIPELPKS